MQLHSLFLKGVETFFALCLTLGASHAQRPWSLSECIAYAKEHNVSVKRQELTLQEAKVSSRQATYSYLPTVGVGGSSNTSHGRILDPTTYEYIENKTSTSVDASVSLTVDLFAGFRRLNNQRLAELNLLASLADLKKAQNDLTLNVTAAYLEILFAEENVKLAESKVKTLKQQEAKTQQMVNARTKTHGDLLQVQAQVSEAESDASAAHGQQQKAYLNLCRLLEVEDYRSFRVATPDSADVLTADTTHTADDIVKAAQLLPDIAGAQLRVGMAEKSVAVAQSDLYPTLSLSGGYGTTYSDAREKMALDEQDLPILNDQNEPTYRKYLFADQVKDNANAYISLSLNIPIFNAWRTRSNIKLSKVALRRAEYDLLLAQKQLSQEVEQLLIETSVALRRYHSSVTAVKASEEAFRYIESKLNVNMATAVDYNVALDNLIKAQSTLMQTKYEYIFKTKVIDFYSGKEIATGCFAER
ncbi:MAG: TolC family protein [Prevotellaceae bacterium]|nr:TolC family protein [Prevotellaceae bacterium]